MGNCIAVSLYTLSVVAHVWLLVQLDPNRETCEELLYETYAALGVNVSMLVLGCLHGMYKKSYISCVDSYITLLLATVSALLVILSSRLTLFVHEAHLICAADVAHVTSDDLLRDKDKRGMLGGIAWLALLSFGVGVLLQHFNLDDCDEDCDTGSRKKVYEVVYNNVGRQPRRFSHPGVRA